MGKKGVECEKEERKATRTEKEVDALEKELVKASPKSVWKRQGRAPNHTCTRPACGGG